MRDESQIAARAALEADVALLDAEVEHLRSQIPESWKGVHDSFQALTTAEDSARNKYRRAADSAYEDALDVSAVLVANADFAAMEPQLRDIRAAIQTMPEAEAEDLVDELSKAL